MFTLSLSLITPPPLPPRSTHIPVLERIVSSLHPSSDVSGPALARPKTPPLPWNIDAPSLQQALLSQPHFGQVHVERSYATPGYVWTVTFTSNVGDQPPLVVNSIDLLGVHTAVAVNTVHPGTLPDNYQVRIVTAGDGAPLSTDFPLLATGLQWRFRVVATNDIGDGPPSLSVGAVPAAPPGAPSALTLGYASATSLLATYPQDAPANGATVTAHLLRVTSAAGEVTLTVPISYKVQRMVTSAYRLPFTTDSTYTLSVGSYHGRYTVYAPGAAFDPSYRLRVDGRNKNIVTSSADAPVWQSDLRNFFTPGEFISVAGQEFRVCMNLDPAFVAVYGSLNATQLALCQVADPFTAKALNAGYAGRVLYDIPVMKMDTTVGGSTSPLMGSSLLTIQNRDTSTNANTGRLSVGDWVSVGHPTAGEVFRVKTAGITTVELSTVADVTVSASLTHAALQHATYEVQALVFTHASPPTAAAGYRLRFRGYSTHLTRAGGDFGCLSTAASATEVRSELLRLLSVDDLLVSKSVSNSTATTYLVTFTGSLVRGDVPPLEVVDMGTNGCSAGAPAGSVAGSVFSGTSHGAQVSVVPVYRLQTTPPLPVSAPARAVKDALEGLSLVTRVEVSREAAGNGLAWTVTFRGELSTPVYPLLVNGVSVKAAVDGGVAVTPLVKYQVTGLIPGVPYYLSVAAQNSHGTGPFTASLPTSKQPVAQPPQSPRQVRAYMQLNDYVDLQFSQPADENTQGSAKKSFKSYGRLNV